jgi:peptide deformylase
MSIFIPPSDVSLTKPASIVDVEHIPSKEIQSIINSMLDIAKGNQLDTGNGVLVGLAAPQIGIMKRIIVVDSGVDVDRKNLGNLVAYVNPQIIWYSDEILWGPEGCYSVDDHLDGKIPRSESIRITAYDREGNFIDQMFSGFTARIFQHEVDHLNGIRFPDRVGENGILHWIPDNQYNQYLKQWEDWHLIFPFELWLDMKHGRAYQVPSFSQSGEE